MIFCYKFTKKGRPARLCGQEKSPPQSNQVNRSPKVRPKALTIRKPVKGRDFVNGFTYYFNEKFSKLF